MKKNSILMLALCSLSFMSFATTPTLVDTLPQKKTVVLEEYTGIGCGNCPYGHLAANQTAAKYPKSVLINIHQGMYASGGLPDLTTPFGDALQRQIGVNAYPCGTLNRQVIAPSKVLAVKDYSQFPAYASKIVEQDAYLNVAASSSIDWLSRILTVNVEVYYTANSPANVNFLNVAVLQSKIMGSQAGMMSNPAQVIDGKYQHNHALRTLLTGQWGDSILTTSKGNVFTKTFTYTIPANIKKVDCILENIEVVAFVCESKKEIINGAKSSMTYINQPSLYVNLLKGEQIVHNSCDSAVSGYVKLINKGCDSIVSAKFKLNAGLDTVEYEWTASAPLMYNQIDSIILLPIPTLPNMTRRFSVQVIALNGQAYNETLPLSSLTFNVLKNRKNGQGNLKLVLVQDRYGSEITWKVYGPNNTIVAFGGPYDDLKSNTTLTLNENIPIQETGCYYFEIKDKAGDGINNGRGVGSYDITDETGAVLASSNGKYKNGEVRYFSMSKGSSVEEIQNTANQVSVYPIPAKQILTFSSASTMQEISIYNTTGQLLKSISTHGNHAEIRIDDLKNGLYIAKIITAKGSISKKIIINK